MADSSFGSNSKGGTVYSGPSPIGTTGAVYGGPSPPPPAVGTVYNGPAVGGTVYNGSPNMGTVYNGAPAGSIAQPAVGNNRLVNAGARRGAVIFYVIAGFTAFRTILLFSGVQQLTLGANRAVAGNMQSILLVNLVAIGIFALLGVFTQNGNKVALVIGMVLYGLDTALLLINPGANIVFIAVHGYFLYRLFNAYRQFAD